MIDRLLLKNWRNYANLNMRFTAGTTFVVASNGIGKTSLIEAINWTLFGTNRSAPVGAVRAGSEVALAIVYLTLPDGRQLEVQRSLPKKLGRTPPPRTMVIDGQPAPEADLLDLLSSVYSADSSFLSRLLMPTGRQDDHSTTTLGLNEHLGWLYGVDNLSAAADELRRLIRANKRELESIKSATAVSAARLNELQAALDSAGDLVTAAQSAHDQAKHRRDRAIVHGREIAARYEWVLDREHRRADLEAVAQRTSRLVGAPVEVDNVTAVLAHTDNELASENERFAIERGVAAAHLEYLQVNRDRLDKAHGDCPVCRRPLDDTTVNLAHYVTDQDIATTQQALNRLEAQIDAITTRRKALRVIMDEIRRLPALTPEPTVMQGNDELDFAAAEDAEASAFAALVDARAELNNAQRLYDEAISANQNENRLKSLWRDQAVMEIALRTCERTEKELLDNTITPMAAEINQRWSHLYPDRGELKMDSMGDITRRIADVDLPSDCFSTGERMGALLLLRILVLQMATEADFCWFDEPLEHLDPDARRQVASLLARATDNTGPLKQVVVTTYEDTLAARLQERDPDRVTLMYARQEHSLEADRVSAT